jgi:hypothetical protein
MSSKLWPDPTSPPAGPASPHQVGRDPATLQQPAGRIAEVGGPGRAAASAWPTWSVPAWSSSAWPTPRSGRWRVGRRLNAPAVRDPAFQDQLQRPRRAALATGVLDAPAVARVEVEDLPVSPDRHAALDPAVASPATATPKPSPQAGKDLGLPSR